MLAILSKISAINSCGRKPNKRSLANVKLGSRKRSRQAQKRDFDIMASLDERTV